MARMILPRRLGLAAALLVGMSIATPSAGGAPLGSGLTGKVTSPDGAPLGGALVSIVGARAQGRRDPGQPLVLSRLWPAHVDRRRR